MPGDVLIYSMVRRCLVRYSGSLRADDVKATLEEQAGRGGWYLLTLIDLTEATGTEVTFADMQDLAACLRKLRSLHGPRGPVAIVADKDDLYCAARMYAISMHSATGMAVAAFRRIDEAERWLGERERT